MRTIKFRAWDKADKCMYEVDEIKFHPSVSNPHILFIDNEQLFEPELMQFTGLLDKNGKEIYESDIIETEHGAKGICKWNDKEAKFDFDCSEPYWSHPIYGMSGEKQVIGNVYEN